MCNKTHKTDITPFGWLELTHLPWATRPGTRPHIRSLRLMLPYGLHKHEDFGAHYLRGTKKKKQNIMIIKNQSKLLGYIPSIFFNKCALRFLVRPWIDTVRTADKASQAAASRRGKASLIGSCVSLCEQMNRSLQGQLPA